MLFLLLRTYCAGVLLALLLPCSLGAQAMLPLMPLPAHVTAGSGSLLLEHGVKIVSQGFSEPRLKRAEDRFLQKLATETGNFAQTGSARLELVVKTDGPSAPVQQLGEDESYQLEIATTAVTLHAANPLGVLHGLQTLLQLVQTGPKGFALPVLTIDDQPRFPWRGLMLDTGRHFMPVSVVYQTLDGMEALKLNVFHWHLSEDQGFRIESTTFPLLQEKGSDGLFYTQQQVRDVLAYSRDRGIRVIPEFDMPGHATAWLVGYPELASGAGPYRIERRWGIFDPAMDPTRESTYSFLDRFFGEMTALFPDAYFHIGGDECNGKEWDRNPRIQAYMRAHGLRGDAALQAYFTSRVQQLVTKRGKITIGWDEVLQPETPKDVVIQSWRGQKSLAEAARRGYRGILSTGYYLDLNEPASQHYAVDPLENETAWLTSAQQKLILGGEAAMWSEFVTPENVGSRLWPRTAAIAERLWSAQSVRDTASMYSRLAIVSKRLMESGLAYRAASEQMLDRLVAAPYAAPLHVLASVVEPPKEYTRESLAAYTSDTPLNRMVDAVPPESDQARIFRDLAGRIAAGTASPAEQLQARQWLTEWRDNDARLQPLLPASSLTLELIPVSQHLRDAATLGLAALDAIEMHRPLSHAELQKQQSTLTTLAAPEAVLIDQIIPGVQALVLAAQTTR